MRTAHRSRLARLALAVVATVAVGSVPTAGSAHAADDPSAWNIYRYNGEPVHWDRCKPIGFRINYDDAPRFARRQILEAVRRLEYRSGLDLVYRGATGVRPYISQDYPNDARLVVGWTTPDRSPVMQRGQLGYGGFQYYYKVDNTGTQVGVIEKAYVQFNKNFNDKLPNGFGRGRQFGLLGTKGQIMMHELGHAVGLDHVNNRPQIMYPTTTRKEARWGRGDVNGLKRVGVWRPCGSRWPTATRSGPTTEGTPATEPAGTFGRA